MIYKIEAEGDAVYVEATDERKALARFTERIGPVPRSLLTISVVKKLPKGEELL